MFVKGKSYDIICTYGRIITEVQCMGCDRGKEEKFEELYQQYRNDVYKISLYYTKNEQEAQDITQKVFFALYLRMDKIELQNAREYLLRAARNLSYNWLRDTKKEREGEDAEEVLDGQLYMESAEATCFSHIEHREKHQILTELMRELYIENENWYEIINLIYCLEMPYDEVTKLLGISKTVLYSKVYRAKQWLLKRYQEKYKER